MFIKDKMDNYDSTSTSTVQEGKECPKNIRKRRSLVFQCRIVCEGTKNSDIEKASECTSKVPQEDEFDLQKYVESLREERKKWLETKRRRKIERQRLIKEKSSYKNEGQVLDLSVLSDSERDFVLAKPNYELMYKNNKRLFDVALKVSTLNQLVFKLNRRFIQKMEKRLVNATSRIIKMIK